MIHEFAKKSLMFPRKWANSVTQWICGICSPSGTIKIVNNVSPTKGMSAKFDVDIEVLYRLLKDRLNNDFVAKDSLEKIVDKTSIIVSNGVLAVHSEYVRNLSGQG